MIVEGFGGVISEPIEDFVTVTFKSGAKISCNVVPEICNALPPVQENISKVWPELRYFKNKLSAPRPRGEKKLAQDTCRKRE